MFGSQIKEFVLKKIEKIKNPSLETGLKMTKGDVDRLCGNGSQNDKRRLERLSRNRSQNDEVSK